MPLINLLATPVQGAIREGDVVFHVADWESWQWSRKKIAHVGIASHDCPNHRLNGPVRVIHMLKLIEQDTWTDGSNGNSCVNLYGYPATLSDVRRAAIVDIALRRGVLTPSFIKENLNLYRMGESSKNYHPSYPDRKDVYSYTCANFVNDCYGDSGQPIVVDDGMPFVTDEERVTLRRMFDKRVQSTPFKRIFPAYLAHALNRDRCPMHTSNWQPFANHGFFVPLPILSFLEDLNGTTQANSP
jgi:hypothetical protein